MPVSNLCCFFGSQITNGVRNILKIAPDIGHLPIVAFLLFTVVSKGYASRFFGTWHCLLFKLPSGRHTPIKVTPVCVHVVCACSSLSGHSAWQAALQVSHSRHKCLPCAIPVKRNRLEQKTVLPPIIHSMHYTIRRQAFCPHRSSGTRRCSAMICRLPDKPYLTV